MPKPPPPPEPEIHRAARVGDMAALRRCVEAGDDINMPADLEVDNGPHLRQLTPLMVAARSIDGAGVETLKWLLDHGANLRAVSEGGETAAWYAAGKGGRWAFHEWKHCPDHVDRLRFLLEAGLDPCETNFVGRSLLVEACEAADASRVRLLLERGAKVNVHISPEQAQERHESNTWNLRKMLEGTGIDDKMLEGHFGIDEAAEVAPHPSSFEIPLYCAAGSGSAECVRLLLEAGADAAARSANEPSALFLAGSPEVVRVLLEAGVSPAIRDSYGKDALTAIMEGNCCGGVCGPERFAAARALVGAGADINHIDKYPYSRLAEAAFTHNAEAVEFLLSLGARTEPPPGAPTALHSICWQGEYQDQETNERCERIIRALVAAGVPVNARNPEGQTPLHEAAGGDWGNQTAVRTLLALGAEVDATDSQGVTPLMCAAEHPGLEVIRLLLEAGADLHKPDASGGTALSRAKGHHASWVLINQRPPDPPSFMRESPEKVAARHREALDEAISAVELLRDARKGS